MTFTVDDPTAQAECRLAPGGDWADCDESVTYAPLAGRPANRRDQGDRSRGECVNPAGTGQLDRGHHATDGHDHERTDRHRRLDVGDLHVLGERAGDRSSAGWSRCRARPCCSVATTERSLRSTSAKGSTASTSRRATWPATLGRSPSRTFTVDTVGPIVTITDGPFGTITATSATILFSIDDPAATEALCRLTTDGRPAPWASVRRRAEYAGLGNGDYLVEIDAIDAVGNEEPTASRSGPSTRSSPTPSSRAARRC